MSKQESRVIHDPDATYVKCPRCKRVSLLDDCDVGGADDGCVFCNAQWQISDGRWTECGAEFNVDENVVGVGANLG